jgi:hypothetical protein
MPFWTNLFTHQKTYTKPISAKKPKWHEKAQLSGKAKEWNKTYVAYLTQLIKTIETQITIQQQIKKLLEVSFYLEKALTKNA